MAAARVFGVTELLEQILAEIPCNQLLLSQRVCRTWQATVQGSKLLKRALFLEPVETTPNGIIPWDPWAEERIEPTPFLNTDSDSDIPLSETTKRHAHWFDQGCDLAQPTPTYIITQNPLMSKVFPTVAQRGKRSPERDYKEAMANPALIRPEASWRKMLWSQPPVNFLKVSIWAERGVWGGLHLPKDLCLPMSDSCLPMSVTHRRLQRYSDERIINSEKGVTLQDLYARSRSMNIEQRNISVLALHSARPLLIPEIAHSTARSLPHKTEEHGMLCAEGEKTVLYRSLRK